MCLIIKTDNPSQLSLNLLQTAYQNNSDGFGVMFCNKGKLHTQKIVPKTFEDIEKVWSKYKNLKTSMGLHFRFNTNGDTARSMSHPFQILSKSKGDDRDMWVMHNGPQLPTPMIDDNKSDTHQFVKWVIRPQLSANPKLLYNAEWQEMIEETIGSDKLLFLDGKTKEFTIYNQQQGKEMDNIGWLSNTYSIQPTNYGVRDYTYDFTTDKIEWKKDSWWNDENNYHYSGLSNASQYTTTTHYDTNNEKKKVVYTPTAEGRANGNAEMTIYPRNNESNLPVSVDGNQMYNGNEVKWEDLYSLSTEELIELCEDNPKGIARYIQEMIIGDVNYD
tara:strand:+ start:407 stop:1399 length:993 start_codon:yes stop_codon:yes gene_type:complete